MPEFYIFSDECGRWNSGPYYVRSWIKVHSDDYVQSEKEVIYSKNKADTKELKYDKFCANQNAFRNIFSVRFNVFITISVPEHFARRSYTILKTLQDIQVTQSTGGQDLTDSIKLRLINSARHSLFFNYFEGQHIENSKASFIGSDSPSQYELMVDNPQCYAIEWMEIARDRGIQKVTVIKKSEQCPGIELADVVVGCIFKKVKGDALAMSIYDQHIKNKMIDMTSRENPNPYLIFYRDFSPAEKTKLDVFR
jgi:hypothetical protein